MGLGHGAHQLELPPRVPFVDDEQGSGIGGTEMLRVQNTLSIVFVQITTTVHVAMSGP
jgi:hypothetical protein